MKMQTAPWPRTLISTKVITWLVAAASLLAVVARTGWYMVGAVQRIDHAAADTTIQRVEREVIANSIRINSLDSAILQEQVVNRNILCYLAKNPAPMVATGACHSKPEDR